MTHQSPEEAATVLIFFVKIAHILLPTPLFPIMDWLESSLRTGGMTEFVERVVALAGQGAA